MIDLQPEEQQIQKIEKAAEEAVFALHQEEESPRVDYRITEENIDYGGAKTRFRNNFEAIRLLKQIENESRFASPDEQEVLSKYVGWGGIPQAFDERNGSWSNEYFQLKTLLTEEEYSAAMGSTLNAHYTSPTVIKSMYAALANMGFDGGRVIEPSCGTGNFFGLVPEKMNAKLTGVELDNITGRIAKQLYPSADISITGFERKQFPDNTFDVAIGNVPFGNYGVVDSRYSNHRFSIHEYFFAKSIDVVRPGGIIAFVTSKYFLDQKDSSTRRYIANRADLIGAIRLPNTAFKSNAGTEVTTDIIFLQKKETPDIDRPEWLNTGTLENGVPVNLYFANNPEMILGNMAFDRSMYGNENETACHPFSDLPLSELLEKAIQNIHANINEYEHELGEAQHNVLPADPSVRNYSYTLVDDAIYYRENGLMQPVETTTTGEGRIKGMLEIRDCVRTLIDYQLNDYSDESIALEQKYLNQIYDRFTNKYGLINSRGNSIAFEKDSSYYLLCSLEVLDDEGKLERKADMFTKRTIGKDEPITKVQTASEALTVSLSEKGCVDIEYMSSLCDMSEEKIVAQLHGVIFRDTENGEYTYRTADDFLSGNVHQKLKKYNALLEKEPQGSSDYPFIKANVDALEKVQPAPLTATDVDVRLGSTWIPPKDITQFIHETLDTPMYSRMEIKASFVEYTGEWNISKKSLDNGVNATKTFGTKRINAYRIIEDTLNLKDVRIFDKAVDNDGKETRVLNKKETVVAQQKQQKIKDAFANWIWSDFDRRERLLALYNERFNCFRPREYDGEHLRLPGMTPLIKLKKHQKNAVARILFGGNSLLAHVVGAGKTFEIVAAAMESKRLGLCNKSMMVVPNHLTEQWATEFLRLYPSANILVTTKKDFQTANRKKFCSRIATGDYDAVIIGHSQFEKLPMSTDFQREYIEEQIRDITANIRTMKEQDGSNYTIKQLEKSKKTLSVRLEELNDTKHKDDVITFEELGVDRLFVDEAHHYKNAFLFTKMRNVAGISQNEAKKSSDMMMKCRYIDRLTQGKGIIFATGTPISNSMTELYVMQRYLQYGELERAGLSHFDSWASTFGETVTSIELAPEGTGYRAKTRFARFFNLPELMAMFKNIADIQTADMLDLPVPKAEYTNVSLKPSDFQKEMVEGLAERAGEVRQGSVDAHIDNMLKITNDGRKLALDQRLSNDMLPDDEQSKVNSCVENAFKIWKSSTDEKAAQLIFSDLSTPSKEFNVYDDIKKKLVARGIPEQEIEYIHSAKSDTQKAALFAKVRNGTVRILLGSTAKMGAGTNVQTRLIALHHLDVPWRPSDIEQREGRILRQGNNNKNVQIFRYVTEETFDAYSWQTIENKQRFISQIMIGQTPSRTCEDIDDATLSYAEIKALAVGNPLIREKMDLELEVSKLRTLKSAYLEQKFEMENCIVKGYPEQIQRLEELIPELAADAHQYHAQKKIYGDEFPPVVIGGIKYIERKDAGTALLAAVKEAGAKGSENIGEIMGFKMGISFNPVSRKYILTLTGQRQYEVELGSDAAGNITRTLNELERIDKRVEDMHVRLSDVKIQLETTKEEVEKPFQQEEELNNKMNRLAELNTELDLDGKATTEHVTADAGHDLAAEIERVQMEFRDMEQPNALEGRAYKVRIDDEYTGGDEKDIVRSLPYKGAYIERMPGGNGMFIFVSAEEKNRAEKQKTDVRSITRQQHEFRGR